MASYAFRKCRAASAMNQRGIPFAIFVAASACKRYAGTRGEIASMAKIRISYKKGGPSQIPALRDALSKPLDMQESLNAVIAELNAFEQQYGLTTVEFFARFKAGLMGDSRDFLKWAGAFDDYRYLIDQYFNLRDEAA